VGRRDIDLLFFSRSVDQAMLTSRHSILEDMQFTNWKDLHAKGKIADAILVCVLVSESSCGSRTLNPVLGYLLTRASAPGRPPRRARHGIFEAGVSYPLRETHGYERR
jgi:hypothetical protein